jgi:hypothetical protein
MKDEGLFRKIGVYPGFQSFIVHHRVFPLHLPPSSFILPPSSSRLSFAPRQSFVEILSAYTKDTRRFSLVSLGCGQSLSYVISLNLCQ